MATLQSNKGSRRAAMHPYLRLERWADGTLAFWRGKQGYNHSEYERRLNDQLKQERNGNILTPNI